jgi:hypothetical protein
MTSLVGPFMIERNWLPPEIPAASHGDVELLRSALAPWLGQLPRIVGMAPFYVFPSALFMMTCLSFFIGIFLQLMWEDLPITEPL